MTVIQIDVVFADSGREIPQASPLDGYNSKIALTEVRIAARTNMSLCVSDGY